MSDKKIIDSSFVYTENEWNRLGCGPLPPEREVVKNKDFTAKQKADIIAKGNPPLDNNVIKGYN